MTQELMSEHEKLMDYAAIECVRWSQDPKNSAFVRQGVGIVQLVSQNSSPGTTMFALNCC
eukprot:1897331-Rhodomonas_salina.1